MARYRPQRAMPNAGSLFRFSDDRCDQVTEVHLVDRSTFSSTNARVSSSFSSHLDYMAS